MTLRPVLGQYRACVTSAATSPMDDPFVAHSLRTSMFFASTRLFVTGNPKAAGTTLRWWLLGAHGVDVAAATSGSLWGESSPAQTVWDRAVDLRYTWERLTDAGRADALDSPDVLTVVPVRHPVTRSFSAWAGKYLTLEPYYQDRLPPGFPPAPDVVASAEHVAELFERFILALRDHAGASGWSGLDVHFWPQHLLLARPVVGEVLVLRQEDMAPGLERIGSQLADHGVTAPPVPRVNENVVPYLPTLVTPAALAAVQTVYAADFTKWRYASEAPEARSGDVDLDWLNDVRGRNRRYAVIHAAAVRGRTDEATLRRLAAVTADRDALLTSRSWRVTRPLRWVSERRPGAHPSGR
jgi:hypothetical protein